MAAVLGIVFGLITGEWAANLKFIGDLFIRLIQMAIVPLVMFTASKAKMGELVAPRWLSGIAMVIAVIIAALNIKLLFDFVLA